MLYIKIQWMFMVFIILSNVILFAFSSSIFHYNIFFLGICFSLIFLLYATYAFSLKFHEGAKSIILYLSWMFIFNSSGIILSYLLNTINYPLITSSLANVDLCLGFDAPYLVQWFGNHYGFNVIFSCIYESLSYQVFFIGFYLCSRGNTRYLESYMMQYMIAAVLTVVISGFMPAVGTYEWYGLVPTAAQLSDVERLYELRQNIVDLGKFNGIVTFPSFHTVAGILITYAFRHQSKLIFTPVLILNILMLFSCLSHGGHFLIDIIGGIAVAAIAVGVEGIIYKYVQSLVSNKTKREEDQIQGILEPALSPKDIFPIL